MEELRSPTCAVSGRFRAMNGSSFCQPVPLQVQTDCPDASLSLVPQASMVEDLDKTPIAAIVPELPWCTVTEQQLRDDLYSPLSDLDSVSSAPYPEHIDGVEESGAVDFNAEKMKIVPASEMYEADDAMFTEKQDSIVVVDDHFPQEVDTVSDSTLKVYEDEVCSDAIDQCEGGFLTGNLEVDLPSALALEERVGNFAYVPVHYKQEDHVEDNAYLPALDSESENCTDDDDIVDYDADAVEYATPTSSNRDSPDKTNANDWSPSFKVGQFDDDHLNQADEISTVSITVQHGAQTTRVVVDEPDNDVCEEPIEIKIATVDAELKDSANDKPRIVLFEAAVTPLCTCTYSARTPSSLESSPSCPFAAHPVVENGFCAIHAHDHLAMPSIVLQPASESDISSYESLLSADNSDQGKRELAHAAAAKESPMLLSETQSDVNLAAQIPTTPEAASEDIIAQFKSFADMELFSPPGLELPEPGYLWTAESAKAAIWKRPKLTVVANSASEISEDDSPLWWRYLVYPIVAVFTSRVSRDVPSRFWIRVQNKIETPLAEATTLPDRELEAELRRQKLLWNVMGILLTGILLGGVVAGVAIYYFGKGGDPGILSPGNRTASA